MLPKRTILLDIDDTLIKTSEEIIRQLNLKNGTNKTIEDLIDYQYKSIDPDLSYDDMIKMHASEDFFQNVQFNDGAIEFLLKYQDIFNIVLVTYGDQGNLEKKSEWLRRQKENYGINHVQMIGVLSSTQNKRDILLPDVYLAIDNKTEHLQEHNAPSKILFKNNQDVYWNQVPVNSNWYVANTFYDIMEMIDFDLKLQEEGIIIGG